MKIFNWVHRRFIHKDGESERNAKKIGVADTDQSSYGAVSDVFDGWKGGILTIGTFGYDPLVKDEIECESTFYDLEPNKEQIKVEMAEEDEEEEEEEEAANLIMFAECTYEYEVLKMERKGKDEEIDDTIIKKERTTLAELFSADSEKKEYYSKGEILMEENNKSNMKYGIFSLHNQDARPVHKLHKLIKRILKRKIHPDDGQNVVAKKCEKTSEAASLLSTQDPNADDII